MNSWLLDTNVLSELRRPRPEPNVIAFITAQPLDHLFISIVSLAELRFGIERLADADRRTALRDWLTHRLRPMFMQRMLPVDEEVMVRWRFMVEAGRKIGHTYSQPDLIIAATAQLHGLTVVTRDVGDYRRANVPVFDPWGKQP